MTYKEGLWGCDEINNWLGNGFFKHYLICGVVCVEGQEKNGWGVSCTTSELTSSTPTSGRLQPRTRGNGAGRRNKGRNISWRNRSLQKRPGLDYGMHVVVCPNVTGRTKERIAQSKRARACSVAIVDYSREWRELVSSGRMSCCLSLALRLVCFASFSSLCFH